MKFLYQYLIPILGAFFVFVSINLKAQDTITVMHYNLLNYGNNYGDCNSNNNDPEEKAQHIKTIINYLKPDVVTVNEISKDETYHQQLLDNAFNNQWRSYYSKAEAPNHANSYIVNQLYYDSRKFGLHSQYVTQSTLRDIDLYRLFYRSPELPNIDTAFIDVIAAHLKAGSDDQDKSRRATMTGKTMNYLNTHEVSPSILFSGDFNIRSSSEESFQNLIYHSNPDIRFHDPVDKVGNWNNDPYYADLHTQSTHSEGDCASGGGMDDRFDFILANASVMNGDDHYHYLEDSYKALGQDGEHFNKSINAYPANNSAPQDVIDALYYASDHLPVVLQLVVDQQGASIAQNRRLEADISYNNPVKDWLDLSITLKEPGELRLAVYSVNGQLMLEKELGNNSRSFTGQINIHHLESGFYIMKLSDGRQMATEKLLVY
ncbi:MAG: T9SS type A sorting domain-containing protein [Bacteroidales bacterium]|nr:T9SS type A sorting domain-containing protein [Bacteroidales bacterium]